MPETRRINIPNALCIIRLIGAPASLVPAYHGAGEVFVGILIFLLALDWLDGKVARWLNQQSAFGARLDTIADLAMYGALAVGAWWLRPDAVKEVVLWILAALASYVLTFGLALIKFHRMPSYHNFGAKLGWLMMVIAAITFFAGGPLWTVKLAMVVVVLTNLETAAMTLVLPAWRSDVPTLYHARRQRRRFAE